LLELPLATASNRIFETATMKSVSVLVVPQAPKPVSKNVPSPSVKGPLSPPPPPPPPPPPVLGGVVLAGGVEVEVVAGGGGCC